MKPVNSKPLVKYCFLINHTIFNPNIKHLKVCKNIRQRLYTSHLKFELFMSQFLQKSLLLQNCTFLQTHEKRRIFDDLNDGKIDLIHNLYPILGRYGSIYFSCFGTSKFGRFRGSFVSGKRFKNFLILFDEIH